MTIEEILKHDNSFKLQMLGRMKSDCDYFINRGRAAKHLWAGSISDQVNCMEAIYNSLPDNEKPTWINREQIDKYGYRMFNAFQREYEAENIYGLFTSYDPYYFKNNNDYIYGKDFIILEISERILHDTENLISDLEKMASGLSKECEFYKDCMNSIRWIRELNDNGLDSMEQAEIVL